MFSIEHVKLGIESCEYLYTEHSLCWGGGVELKAGYLPQSL